MTNDSGLTFSFKWAVLKIGYFFSPVISLKHDNVRMRAWDGPFQENPHDDLILLFSISFDVIFAAPVFTV